MKATKISEGVYWVGVADWNLRDFHHVSTHKGSSYNSYLILDDKKVLIDTVKASFYEEMISKIRGLIDPSELDYIIVNHMELDHAGSLRLIAREAPKATIIVSERYGEESLERTFHPRNDGWKIMPVKEGSEINLGKRRIRFIPIPMVHWPDSMADYLVEEQILFPNDAFSGHFAAGRLFDDENNMDEVMLEVKKYYATLLVHLGESIKRAMSKLEAVPLKIIAPAHGIVWRSHVNWVMKSYRSWSEGNTLEKALIIYGHMWGSTEKMAMAIAEGMRQEGMEHRLFDLCISDRNDVMTDVLDSRAVIVGSSTMHNAMLPPVASFLCQMKGLRPKGKLGAAFGSYGWGGGAIKAIEQELKLAGLEVIPSELSYKYVPSEEELLKCRDFGSLVARKIKLT